MSLVISYSANNLAGYVLVLPVARFAHYNTQEWPGFSSAHFDTTNDLLMQLSSLHVEGKAMRRETGGQILPGFCDPRTENL